MLATAVAACHAIRVALTVDAVLQSQGVGHTPTATVNAKTVTAGPAATAATAVTETIRART